MTVNSLKLAVLTGTFLSIASLSLAQTASQPQTDGKTIQPQTNVTSMSGDLFSQWWNGKSALDNWFGLGKPLSDHGLTITGTAKQEYYGQVSGGYPSNQSRSNWVNEEKLNAVLNFGQLLQIEGLDGLTFTSIWRYRNVGNNPAFEAGTAGPSSTFKPSADDSGLGVRILPQYLQWQSERSNDPNFLINLGWENPYDQFLQQPLSKDFMNNNIASAKGIGATLGNGIYVLNTQPIASLGQTPANGYNSEYKTGTKGKNFTTSPVPWSSSYAAWGGTLRAKPSSSTYIQSGLYEAISGTAGVGATQFSSTQVYPYTQVPSSLMGAFNSTGLVYQLVGANGQPLFNKNGTPKLAATGFIPGYNQNHGFNFQGAPASNVHKAAIGQNSVVGGSAAANYGNGGFNPMNGLYNVNEIGWTPKFGSDKSLEGHYAVGSYIWGQENTSFTPTGYNSAYTKQPYSTQNNPLQWGLYFQADQRLYAVKEQVASPSLDDKNPVSMTSRLTDKGLYMFNEFTFTTPQNNAMPAYFQTGLVYKGLIPHRDHDSIGIALGAGFYSSYYNSYLRTQNQALVNSLGSSVNATAPNGPVQEPANGISKGVPAASTFYGAYVPMFTSTEVVEAYYKIQINEWATLSPDVQWICNPAGNGTLGNEWILGAEAKVTF